MELLPPGDPSKVGTKNQGADGGQTANRASSSLAGTGKPQVIARGKVSADKFHNLTPCLGAPILTGVGGNEMQRPPTRNE